MSQRHFPDDPLIGLIVTLAEVEWEVTDIWVDIGSDPNSPRNATLTSTSDDDTTCFPVSTIIEFLHKEPNQ